MIRNTAPALFLAATVALSATPSQADTIELTDPGPAPVALTALQSDAVSVFFEFQALGSTVEGVIRGLNNNATGAATSVEVTAGPAAGIGEYIDAAIRNEFTLLEDQVVLADFSSNRSTPFISGILFDDDQAGLFAFRSALIPGPVTYNVVPIPEPYSLALLSLGGLLFARPHRARRLACPAACLGNVRRPRLARVHS